MSRRSSNPDHLKRVSADILMVPAQLGFTPTPLQQKWKSEFWSQYRGDPTVDPAKLTPAEVAQLSGADVSKEWSNPLFRAWFTNSDTWRHQLEFALDSWMGAAVQRLHQPNLPLSDKDFIQMGKLLAEMGGKMQRGAPKQEPEKQLTEAQAREQFDQMARQLGYVLPDSNNKK